MPQISLYDPSTPTAAQFRRLSAPYVNPQTGTTYTLTAADDGGVVTLTNTNPIAVTVPVGLPVSFFCVLIQAGTGVVTVQGAGATINSYSGWARTAGQHSAATLIYTAPNVYNLSGNLTA